MIPAALESMYVPACVPEKDQQTQSPVKAPLHHESGEPASESEYCAH